MSVRSLDATLSKIKSHKINNYIVINRQWIKLNLLMWQKRIFTGETKNRLFPDKEAKILRRSLIVRGKAVLIPLVTIKSGRMAQNKV